MNDRTILAEHAAELAESEDPGAKAGPWTRVDEHHYDTGRWHEKWWLVIRDEDGQLWGIEYKVGLTENQETRDPWYEDGVTELPLTRIYRHEVVRVDYRTKPAGGDR